jgi:hypothetical protein
MHQYFIGPERGRRHQEHFLIDPWTSIQLKPTQCERVPCALIPLAESNRFAGTALMPIDIPQNERKERDTQLNRARAWIRDQADPAYFAFSYLRNKGRILWKWASDRGSTTLRLCLADDHYPPQRFQSLVFISFSFVSSSYLGWIVVLATVIAIPFSIYCHSQHYVDLDLNIDFNSNEWFCDVQLGPHNISLPTTDIMLPNLDVGDKWRSALCGS